jgi:hypothetical protein
MYRFEGQISGKNIEIGIIGADRQFRYLPFFIHDYCLWVIRIITINMVKVVLLTRIVQRG